MNSKLLQKKQFKKQQKRKKSQKLHHKILQRQLKVKQKSEERYIPPEKKQETIFDQRLLSEYGISNNKLVKTIYQINQFRTRNWVEVNYDSRGTYNNNSQIKFETAMWMLSLCDYSNAYILVKGTITILNLADTCAAANNASNN